MGSGFGGLRAAKQLSNGLKASGLNLKYEIILIDKQDHHTYTPLLYEIATTSKGSANIKKLHDLAGPKIESTITDSSIVFLQKEISEIDSEKRVITFSTGTKLEAEYIILALGAETNYFNIPGLKENSVGLKTLWDSIKIRETITRLSDFKKEVRIVIGGGGSTGVEFAGELKVWCASLSKNSRFTVDIIETAPTILSGLDKRVSIKARRRLNKLGVRITENDKVSSVLPHEVTLRSGKVIKFDLLVWTGGVKASAPVCEMSGEKDERGRIKVSGDLSCIGLKNIYAIGDNAFFLNPKTGKPIPGVARSALIQADIAASNILETIKVYENLKKRSSLTTFKPANYPYLIPIGGKWALAKIGPFVISGLIGWIIKMLTELEYLWSIMSPLKAKRLWFSTLKVIIQND